jgi:hypothetical protein
MPSRPISQAEAMMSRGGASKASLKRVDAGGLARIDCRKTRRRGAEVVPVIERHVEEVEDHALGSRVVEGVQQR